MDTELQKSSVLRLRHLVPPWDHWSQRDLLLCGAGSNTSLAAWDQCFHTWSLLNNCNKNDKNHHHHHHTEVVMSPTEWANWLKSPNPHWNVNSACVSMDNISSVKLLHSPFNQYVNNSVPELVTLCGAAPLTAYQTVTWWTHTTFAWVSTAPRPLFSITLDMYGLFQLWNVLWAESTESLSLPTYNHITAYTVD